MKPQLQIEPPPHALISPLLELRDYYARLVEEYGNLYNQARSQLTNVEGLLSSWSASEANNKLLTAEVVNELLSSSKEDLLLSPSSHHEAREQHQDSEPQDVEALETDSAASLTINIKDFSLNNVDIPMLSEYQSLTRMEAIKKLLEQHLGAVCHIDFIVRSLYGDLEPHVFKVVKGRVQSSLTQGREKQTWFGIPNEPGCYTLDLGLVNVNQTNHLRTGKSKKKPLITQQTTVIPMLKAYEGQFLIDALSIFFRQNPGKVFSVAEVIAGIYGQLSAEEVREVKSKVLNELSRGYRTGRFSRMPDTVGFYTLDTKLVRKANSG